MARAAKACHDIATAYETPFISGKDSLHNEYKHKGGTIEIPDTLLISAISVIDAKDAITMAVITTSTRSRIYQSATKTRPTKKTLMIVKALIFIVMFLSAVAIYNAIIHQNSARTNYEFSPES